MYQDFFSNNDDYLNEFKQKVANQKIATLEERQSEIVHSRNNFLGTFAGITLAGVLGWFVLAPQYAEINKEIPIIRRPQTAVKIKPENPGGMEILNRDKDVYNIVEKKNIDTTVVENLLPKPEKPKLPDIVPDMADVDSNASNLDALVEKIPNSEMVAENSNIPNKPTDVLANSSTDKISAKSKPDETKLEAPKVEKNVVTVESKKIAPEKKKANKTDTAQNSKAGKTSIDGKWQIQLLVSRNKDSVEKTWKTLSAKYALLNGYPYEIQMSNLGSQGMFYRLRAGSFASKAEAAQACATLKSQGLADCITKER